ncbi:hypothetical protein C7212DRAFT_342718 [Tuber magnatum]|uniref:Uncharacterized protein n=1 Tax=Tuber magnatum TaxID=42249 RepID=A0A317SSR4_9PEZI|nr:hypothetical protein C7212DRAFT_342718 [Tuber magnatum]
MEGKTTASPSSSPTKLYVPRSPLQRAAITINALANSEYLTHFPVVTPGDTAYASRIVQDLPLGVGSNTHTLAFAMSTPMSLASSPEFTSYAALQNEVTAGAILKHWRLVKASRELNTPTPVTKGAGDCGGVWDALEKCWGKKVAEDAWFDYLNSGGEEKAGGGEGGAVGGESGDPRGRPWKRTNPDLMLIDGAVGQSGGSEHLSEGARERPTPATGAVRKSGGREGPRVETRKRAFPDPTPTPSAGGPAPARPHKMGRTLNSLENIRGRHTVRHPSSARSGSCPGDHGAGPELEPGHDM